jgi:hypothetical protein
MRFFFVYTQLTHIENGEVICIVTSVTDDFAILDMSQQSICVN